MTVTQPNLLHQYLSAACLGGLVHQMLAKRGIDSTEPGEHPEVVAEIITQLNELGIHAGGITEYLLHSLVALHAKPENAEIAVRSYAELLWKILGHPEDGESQPPALYFKAGAAVHAVMIALLDPAVFDD